MAGWRYLAQRLTGTGAGEFLDFALPLSNVQISRELSGPSRLTATITPEIGRMRGDDGRLLLEEWGSAVFPETEGQIRGGFIVVHSEMQGEQWQLDCIGYAGYPQGMPYTESIFFVEADPMDIARHIWDHLQAQRGGNLAVVVDSIKSPVRIGERLEQAEFDTQAGPVSFEAGPYKLTWYQTDDLGKNFDDLAKQTPFEYDEEHAWAADGSTQIDHRIRLFYPRKGRRRDDLRFAIGENIQVIPTLERDGDEYANEVLALGAGEGRDMIRAQAANPDGRLRRVAVVTDKSARSERAARDVAGVELAARQVLDDIREVVVSDHPHAPLGSFDTGDDILIQGDLGWTDVMLWVRVLSITMSPERPYQARVGVARVDAVTATS